MVKITTTSYLLFSSSATAVPSITVNLDQDISSFSLFHSSCVNLPMYSFSLFFTHPWARVTTTCHFHCLIGVKTSPHFHFAFTFQLELWHLLIFTFTFFNQTWVETTFHQHESGHLLISTFSIQPKLRPLFTFTLSIGVKTSAHYHFHFSAMESASLNSILDTQQQNFFAQE